MCYVLWFSRWDFPQFQMDNFEFLVLFPGANLTQTSLVCHSPSSGQA